MQLESERQIGVGKVCAAVCNQIGLLSINLLITSLLHSPNKIQRRLTDYYSVAT